MITDENKWVIIEAYLAGQLDEPGRQEVAQKMADDATFRADVLMQSALNQHLDQEQTATDYALVDRYLDRNAILGAASPRVRLLPVWQQPWLRAVAAVVLLLGLGWFGYSYWSPPGELSVKMVYEQRDYGMAGTSRPPRLTTYLVEFSDDGPTGGAYSSESEKIHLYLPDLPPDSNLWRLRDDQQGGGFLLTTPQGKTYQLDRDTFGQQKPLN